jgi:hypothetical protein
MVDLTTGGCMSTWVRYAPENRELDLSRLAPTDYELISGLHGEIRQGDATLLCLQASSDQASAEMYIRRKCGMYWAVHFPGYGHGPHAITMESDEHRRQKDYWCRAAQDVGFDATTEFRTGKGTVLDVAIRGNRHTGVEIQHSYNKASVIKTRTTKSFKAGWLPVWFLDSDRRPDWFYEVPTVASNPLPWTSLPPRRAATAIGLSQFVAEHCRPGRFDKCPGGHRRPCSQWHPKREPWPGLTVDDIAARVPAGEIVPLRDTAGAVHLTSPRSAGLYRELTDQDCAYTPEARGPRSGKHGQPRLCTNPHRQGRRGTCSCGNKIYPLTQLVRAAEVCERCRITLGLPRPHKPDDR